MRSTRYTTHFGSFVPEKALRRAQEYAHSHSLSVTEALLSLTADMEWKPDGGAEKLLVSGDEDRAKMLAGCFGRYPILAARLTFDAGRSHTAVEYNPLWLELRQQQKHVQNGMGLEM